MENNDEIKKELESIAPFLSRLPKQEAFKVEDNYFETLPMFVMDRILDKKKKKVIDLTWLLQPHWAVTMAVCFLAVVAGSFFLLRQSAVDKPMAAVTVQHLLKEKITTETVIDDVDADILVEAVVSERKSEPASQKNEMKTKKQVNKKALEEYILNNVDASSIIDQL